MTRHVCIHGHFYQPPRENPWLEGVELQDSAYPYHDWNARITAECYARNAASRILDAGSRIIDIVNNYSKISFNFGPTLLSWLEAHEPETYVAVIEADRASRERFSGHGSALAQVYNHMIMPLANSRDRRTQILWGIRDFSHRFGRRPEGMWLPETAVDLETLDLLARRGIRFTILAPRQAARVRPLGGGEWMDVGGGRIDPKVPYLCRLRSGRSIALFFYDGPISQDVAFRGLLNDGEAFAHRLADSFTGAQGRTELVHIATDGETYGHHHPYGDMALAYCLYHIESEGLAQITVYGEFLERCPPTQEVEVFEQSSWSCVHGVERWRGNCGCNTGRPSWNQEWRAPLRRAMEWLRDELVPLFQKEASRYLRDPWGARDSYIDVILDRSEASVGAFLARHAVRELSAEDRVRALKLLELQRHSMLMQTSCGWFFDELSGIETVQVMQYAARAMQLAREVGGPDLEPGYLEILKGARSNVPGFGDGSRVFQRFVQPAAIDLLRVGAHYAISTLFEDYEQAARIFAYSARAEVQDKREAGRQRLSVGRVWMRSEVTWEEADVTYAVLHLGDHNVNGGVRLFQGEESFAEMHRDAAEAFSRSDVAGVIRLMDRHFGTDTYSLWHLFRDEQRKALGQIRYSTLDEVESAFRALYHNNYTLMNFLSSLNIPLPKAFRVTAEYAVNSDLRSLFGEDGLDLQRLSNLIEEVQKWTLEIDGKALAFVARSWIEAQMANIESDPGDLERMDLVSQSLVLLQEVGVEPDLWKAQNRYFSVGKRLCCPMSEKAAQGDDFAPKWLEGFRLLGEHLRVKVG